MENKKYYYARQLDGECFDYEAYWDEQTATEGNMWFGGNRDFCDINKDLRQHICNIMSWINDDIDDEKYALEEGQELNQVDIDRIVNYYFHKENREKLTTEETKKVVDLINKYYHERGVDDNEIICQMLEIEFGYAFKTGIIKGCCQGDWMDYIIPESTTDEMIHWIEAVLMATGTEYQITCEPIESANDFDDADVYCDYTYLWRTEDIRKWLADNIGCKEDEVKIIQIKNTHLVKRYEYEEI